MLIVSLIVTTFNSRENFCKTYQSICTQTYPYIEIVVVDGESIDGTREEIERCAKTDRRIRWISEKDTGIYNALNKGIKMSTGDVLAICNDEFTSKYAVEKYVLVLEKSRADGVHSDLVYKGEKGQIVRTWRMGKGTIRNGWMPGHPTLYLRREVYEKFGLYKENYRCAADYEFMVRVLKDNSVNLTYLPETLISMFYGGTSSNGVKAYWISFKEGWRALRENKVKWAIVITCLRTIRVLKQFV